MAVSSALRVAGWYVLRGSAGLTAAVLVASALIQWEFITQDPLSGFHTPAAVVSGGLALLFAWMAIFGHRLRAGAQGAWLLVGGFSLGIVGFVAGFVSGPWLYPESNLSPLLGVITGGLGLVAGLVLGATLAGSSSGEEDEPRT